MMRIPIYLMFLCVVSAACSKSADGPDEPTTPLITDLVDSIIQTLPPVTPYSSYKRTIYTFESDSLSGIYKIKCFDSLGQYNGTARLSHTVLTFWLQPGTDKLLRVQSRSKHRYRGGGEYVPAPFLSDEMGNFNVVVTYSGPHITPWEIVFTQFKDSTATTVHRNMRFERDWMGSTDKPTIYTNSDGSRISHSFESDYVPERTLLAITPIDSIYFRDQTFEFQSLLSGLDMAGRYTNDRNNYNLYLLNKEGSIKEFNAINYYSDPYAPGPGVTELLERKVQFLYDADLLNAMEPLASRRLLKNLGIWKMVFPAEGIYEPVLWFGKSGYALDDIYKFKVISKSATDSLFNLKGGKRELIHVNNTSSIIGKDARGRVKTVVKAYDPFSITEKFEFIYR